MSVDRKSRNEANIRMMALLQDPPGWRCKDRLQDEAQDNAGLRKRTPPGRRTRAEQDVRWIRKIRIDLRMSYFASGWCESRMREFMDEHWSGDLRKSFQGRAGSTNVAGMLQNEPGALFIQCTLFLFLLRICYPAPGF